jgi:hypothetical protein
MEIDDANERVIREALRRLGPNARLDPALLQEQIAEVVKQQRETIFAQLGEAACQRLPSNGPIERAPEHLPSHCSAEAHIR